MLAHGGLPGARGSVSYLFNEVGRLVFPPGTGVARLTGVAVQAGAEDVIPATREVLTDPKLAARTLEISLGDELPTSRATYLVGKVGRQSEHPEVAWNFAKAHMKQLLAKADALSANSYAPSLFNLFSDAARIAELERYAKSDLPPAAAKDVAKAIDELGFRAELKPRLLTQIGAWLTDAAKGH